MSLSDTTVASAPQTGSFYLKPSIHCRHSKIKFIRMPLRCRLRTRILGGCPTRLSNLKRDAREGREEETAHELTTP